jgi:hypothetical protein
MTYNIPGVFTSVIDRSYIQPLVVEGRSVLIAGFSKFGEDKFYNFADANTMKFTLGDMDIKRFGLGLMYGLDALTKTRNVIFKRLMPADATFANLLFKTDGTTETWPDVIDPDTIRSFLDADEGVEEPALIPVELEVKSFQDQVSVFIEYNPENIIVYLNGLELADEEYDAVNGQEIIFNSPLAADKIINVYTVIDNIPTDEPQDIDWINVQYVEPSADNTIVDVPGGYTPGALYITLNGLELSDQDFTAVTSPEVTFHLGGQSGVGLRQGDIVKFHSHIDNTGFGNRFLYTEHVVRPDQDGATELRMAQEYNPIFTLLSINGAVLGMDDYRADDGWNIYFSSRLSAGDIVRLHSIVPGDFAHYFGALISKAAGEGYNDLFVQFRAATDVEKFYSDEEGDSRYKFNFLKATIFEQTVNGQRKVSDEFVVSLIEEDPTSLMPIISNVTGDALYINTKFGESNEFVDFYINESFLPLFKHNLSINELTANAFGEMGANRLILKETGANSRERNIELVVNNEEGFEKKSTVIEGKEAIYTFYNDPYTGNRISVSIRIADGKFRISEEGSTQPPVFPLYIDGVNSFYESYITLNPNYDPSGTGTPSGDPVFSDYSKYIIAKIPYKTIRQDLYDQLIGSSYQRSLWQMQSGYTGENIIRDGKLNMGYVPGNLYAEDAKQLLIQFYNENETIHEVLYPELDFDYVPDWTQDIDVMNSIVQFADEIGFTMPIISLPRQKDPEDDYLMRVEDVYLSSYNTAMYSGQNNDNHYMAELGIRITCPASYYAMINHLNVDEQISITEPMANIVKGQLPVSGAKLSYIAKSYNIEKLRGVQVNTIIKEIDGIYFIDQLTAYKSASKLSRINVVKVIHRIRKDLPKILKDLLQRKALENVLLSAKTRTEKYMDRWLVTDNNTTDGIFSEIDVTPMFVEEELKLIVSVAVRPIGTIEKIEVPITVY